MPETPVRKKPAKKAATKRTVRKSPAKKATTKRVTRKTVSRSVSTNAAITTASASMNSTRKAPTQLAANAVVDGRRKVYVVVSLIVFVVLLGVSAAIGFSDRGAIVVSEQFEKRLQAADEQERQVIQNITLPKPTKDDKPLGGLVGTGKSQAPAPVPQPVATSTDETATSTEAVSEDEPDGSTEVDETVPAEDVTETSEPVQ